MYPTPTTLERRLYWEWDPPPTSTCGPYNLPSGGVIVLGPRQTITLTQAVLFRPNCSACPVSDGITTCIDDETEPFSASVTPMVYVIALCTALAWTLLLGLLVSPNSIAPFRRANQSSHFMGFLARISNLFFLGSRPWLQKVAALLTSVSMIVATGCLFDITEDQYVRGVSKATAVRSAVAGTKGIRILRIFSDVFLWLAQIQTLIRVFPRHKEKLLIKWIGFLLILLDIIFSLLNSFWVDDMIYSPAEYTDAISALAYLFQLSLSLLYATWIFYYAMTKRRYAFYHDRAPGITILAILSTTAILIPVGFFIVDVYMPSVSAWGDFFRWIGALASSIIVWEWVERIESIEREEKKDGILGREIFDGDEMIDDTPSNSQARSYRSSSRTGSSMFKSASSGSFSPMKRFAQHAHDQNNAGLTKPRNIFTQRLPMSLIRPRRNDADTRESERPFAFTSEAPPVDRSQAASTESTVYNIRYSSVTNRASSDPPPPTTQLPPPAPAADRGDEPASMARSNDRDSSRNQNSTSSRPTVSFQSPHPHKAKRTKPIDMSRPFRLPRPFKRTRKSPPIQVKNALSTIADPPAASDLLAAPGPSMRDPSVPPSVSSSVRGFRARFSALSSESSLRSASQTTPTVIPAPPRGHTWSPGERRHSPLETITAGGTPGTVVGPTPRPEDDDTDSHADDGEGSESDTRPPHQPASSPHPP